MEIRDWRDLDQQLHKVATQCHPQLLNVRGLDACDLVLFRQEVGVAASIVYLAGQVQQLHGLHGRNSHLTSALTGNKAVRILLASCTWLVMSPNLTVEK